MTLGMSVASIGLKFINKVFEDDSFLYEYDIGTHQTITLISKKPEG